MYEESYNCDSCELSENSEFKQAIDALIDSEIEKRNKDLVKTCNSFLEKNKIQHNKIMDLTAKLLRAENLFEDKLPLLLEEQRKKTEREVTGGFAISDKTFYCNTKTFYINCAKCTEYGQVKVTFADGSEKAIKCPVCNGGKISKYLYTPVEATLNRFIYYVNEENVYYFDVGEEGYLSTQHKQDRFFHSIEECQTKCDELNKKHYGITLEEFLNS